MIPRGSSVSDSSRRKFGHGNVTNDSGTVKAAKTCTLKKTSLCSREDIQKVLM